MPETDLGGTTPEAVRSETALPSRADAVVVGGGIAGLTAAYGLALTGARPVLLEASEHLGGPVRALSLDLPGREAPIALDAGAESFATRSREVASLVSDLGLTSCAPGAGGAWGWVDGRAFPLPGTSVLGIPGRPWEAEVRRALGPWGTLRALADAALPRGIGAGESSLAGLVEARMGSAVAQRLVATVAGGVHAASPRDLDLDVVAPGLRAAMAKHGSLAGAVRAVRSSAPPGAAVRGIVGGLHRLPAALADWLRAPAADDDGPGGASRALVRTSTPVTRLTQEPDGVWLVEGTGFAVRATRVVLATDRAAAASLLAGLAPALAEPRPSADIVLVSLVLATSALAGAPRGTGILARGPGVVAKALTHVDAKWPWVRDAIGPGHAAVRLSYGRPGEVLADPDGGSVEDWLPRQAVRDAAAMLGVGLSEDDVVASAVTRWPAALPPPSPHERVAREAFLAAVDELAGLAVTGSWVAGTGLAATIPHALSTASEE